MAPETLLSAAAWSVGGFVIGYITAGWHRDIHTIKEAIVPEEKPVRRVRPYVPSRTLGALVVVMAVLTVVAASVAVTHKENTTECQARVNRDLITALNQRAVIADNDRKALDDLILAIVGAQQGTEQQRREAGQQAIENYVRTIKTSREARAHSALPSPDDYDCDTGG